MGIPYIDLLNLTWYWYQSSPDLSNLKASFVKIPDITLINIIFLHALFQELEPFLYIPIYQCLFSIVRKRFRDYFIHLRVSFYPPGKPMLPKVRQALRLQDSILAGKTPLSKLRFLDLEYNAHIGLVFEVGMCDAMGQVTMDCLTRLSPAELTRTSRPIDKVSIRIAERHYRTVIKDHQCCQGTLNVHQIAKQLKAEGITPETTFVVWARNKSDLRLLREWLEAEGYSGILSPDSNCVPVTNDFQINLRTSKLSNGKQFPTSLPIIFPVFFGTHHHLYGRNHQAIFDTLRLWLMNEAFKQLCLPPSDRDQDLLSKLGNLGKQQGSLDNY